MESRKSESIPFCVQKIEINLNRIQFAENCKFLAYIATRNFIYFSLTEYTLWSDLAFSSSFHRSARLDRILLAVNLRNARETRIERSNIERERERETNTQIIYPTFSMNIRYIIVTKDKVLFDQFGIISSFHEIKCNDSTKFRFSEICQDWISGQKSREEGRYASFLSILIKMGIT